MSITRAYAGQVAAYGQALHKTTCETLTTSKPLTAGLFVAYAERGVKELTGPGDKVAGVIVRNVINDEFKTGEPVDVMQIGAGDAIWVIVKEEETLARGDLVSPDVTGVKKDEAGKYSVIEVADGLAKITKA